MRSGGKQDAREARALQLRDFASVDQHVESNRAANELIAENVEHGLAGRRRKRERLCALLGRRLADLPVRLQIAENNDAADHKSDQCHDEHKLAAEHGSEDEIDEQTGDRREPVKNKIAWHGAFLRVTCALAKARTPA